MGKNLKKQNFLGSPGVPWDSPGSPGIPWGPLGSHGIPWGPMGSPGVPWGPWGPPRGSGATERKVLKCIREKPSLVVPQGHVSRLPRRILWGPPFTSPSMVPGIRQQWIAGGAWTLLSYSLTALLLCGTLHERFTEIRQPSYPPPCVCTTA